MDKTTAAGILKVIVAILALSGTQVTEIQTDQILAGWLAIHSIISAVQSKWMKDK